MRWIHPEKRRYYTVYETIDLWGQRCLVLCWGSLDSWRGGLKTVVLDEEPARARYLARLAARRARRGYEPAPTEARQIPATERS